MARTSLLIIEGCLVNSWYGADVDPVMKRTKTRPTVTVRISLNTALVLGIGTTVLGLILLLFTTVQAAVFAFLGWFVYIVLYTMWLKRRYTLNTATGSFSGVLRHLLDGLL
ncbi:UbiA family prenyltransferase [Virgibacillus oceani]